MKELKIETWNDLCDYSKSSDDVRVSGYCISNDSKIYMAHRLFAGSHSINVFATQKEAKSALAMSQISQLMPYYGGAITDEEWDREDMVVFYTIERVGNKIHKKATCFNTYKYLAFRTRKQRDSFLNNNYRLVKDYFMLD